MDFDGMVINYYFLKSAKEKKKLLKIDLPQKKCKTNFYSMTITLDNGSLAVLKNAQDRLELN